MKESCGEGFASRSDLKSYAESGDRLGVASMRGTGRPAMELRNHLFRVPTLWWQGEGNTCVALMASGVRHGGVEEPEHVWKP